VDRAIYFEAKPVEDDVNMKPKIFIIGVVLAIAGLIAIVVTLDVTLQIGPTVSATAICPDGSPVHLVIPVDCFETCGVNLPAEKELESHER